MFEKMEYEFAGWLKNMGLGAFATVIRTVLLLLVGLFLITILSVRHCSAPSWKRRPTA